MNSLRIARAAAKATGAVRTLQRRGYADVAPDKIRLSLALPHQHWRRGRSREGGGQVVKSEVQNANIEVLQAIYKSQDVVQVNLPAESGEMGILAQHVPSIEQLKPGLVEIIEEAGGSKQFFLSGGFATVQPGSVLSINAVEGFPLEDFSTENVRNQITEAQKIASGSGSAHDIAEAQVELEVLESLQAALKVEEFERYTEGPYNGGDGFFRPETCTTPTINVRLVRLTPPTQRAKLSRLTLATKKSRKLLRKEPSTSSITPSSTTSTTRGSSPSSDENTTPRQPLSRQPSDVSWRSNLLRGGYNSKENKAFGSSRSLFHYTGHSTPTTPRGDESEDDEEGEGLDINPRIGRQPSAGHTPYVALTPKASAASNLSGVAPVVPVSILKKKSVDVLALSRQTSLCDKCKGETDTESAKSSLVEGVQPAAVVSRFLEETQSAVLLATPTKQAPPPTASEEATPAVTLREASPAPEPSKEFTAASTALKIAMWPIPPPTNKKKKPIAPRSPPRVTFTPETPEPPPTPPINPKSSTKPAAEKTPTPRTKPKFSWKSLFKRKPTPSSPSPSTSTSTMAQ
ncbi:hypothetical protein B0A48_13283 [Cryoendolithus antarcticus]|uniref:ATP synthase subunit delta, mitochondrial n=1 Tax=Cryoendolithus antarcticus TaxID=1507870 RepID=A0A1V8SPQ3_9PEZI|nr:hypothetical protein B0A48_13283 [Cryoendolithus antarcticus]